MPQNRRIVPDASVLLPAYFRERLVTQANIAPPDSWYLACARQYDAELWISHEHHDRFAEHARACHPKVYLLTEDDFDHPRNR
jgi:hypothetical protein